MGGDRVGGAAVNAFVAFVELLTVLVVLGSIVTIIDRKTGLLARLERWLER